MHQVLMISLAAVALQGAYSFKVDLDHPDGFYQVGQTATCTATLLKEGQPAAGEKFRCSVKQEGKVVETRDFESAGQPVTIQGTIDRPGWIYFGFEVLDTEGRPHEGPAYFKHSRKPSIVGEIGAVFEPEKIRAVSTRPADFEVYWGQCRKQLDAVPLKAKLTPSPVPEDLQTQVECFSVEVACLGKNPVRGYLALPKGAKPKDPSQNHPGQAGRPRKTELPIGSGTGSKSLPAIVGYQGLSWADASKRAAIDDVVRYKAISLHTSWHALPTGHDAKYYDEFSKTWYQPWDGDEDRDTWFFHDLFYRVMRAMDFIKSRPEWNRKDLIVSGGSLGGIQTIAAAALEPRVTLAVVSVPSFCEFQSFRASRDYAPVCYRTRAGLERLKGDEKIQTMLSYHDAVNFAPMIKCDDYACTGFTDELCSPSTVYAFYNNLTAARSKTMTTDPRTGHYGATPNVKGVRRLEELFTGRKVHP